MAPFSRQLTASVAQLLATMPGAATTVLVYKHMGLHLEQFSVGTNSILQCLEAAGSDGFAALLVEVVETEGALRSAVTPRYVFDQRFKDFSRWLAHDGWAVEDGQIKSVGPAVEETTGLRDELLEGLAASPLDTDRAVTKCLNDSATSFMMEPPDYNDSATKVRIALETYARRLAQHVSSAGNGAYEQDTWGKALAYLRAEAVITQNEEAALAAVYTITGPGAHVPQGLDAEQWARLVRTLCIGGIYLLAHVT